MKYAVHYESTGRLGSFDNPTYSNLLPDFQYLAQNYFNNANYYRIDNRPVVFIYLTRAYFNTQAGQSGCRQSAADHDQPVRCQSVSRRR